MDENTGVKISLLPFATSPADADILAGVQGNTTKKFSLSAIKSWLNAVPQTRKVNSKALSSDITLDASDVGARPDDWMPTATQLGAEAEIQLGSITLSTTWIGSVSPYTQIVTVTGASITENSKVDLQPTAAQIASLISDGVAGMVVENNNGTLTAYAIEAVPSAAMTLQVTVTEVTV